MLDSIKIRVMIRKRIKNEYFGKFTGKQPKYVMRRKDKINIKNISHVRNITHHRL